MSVKDIRYYVSLYIIIPVIFGGLAALSAIMSFNITKQYPQEHGLSLSGPVFFWIMVISAIAFLIGLVVVWLILKPVQKFVKRAEELPVLVGSGVEKGPRKNVDELQHYARVFTEVTDVLSKVDARQLFPEIIAESQAMRGVLSQIRKVAPTDSTALIFGESGTGKELVATSIYEHSLRKDKPFIKLNCVAIPEELLESELFGYEKGAFTGADSRKLGKFEIADHGTIFLDEIGDMPINLQAKLLRVLQEREFERVGGAESIKIDVRFIAATNKDLEKLVKEGKFRQDLYYRLNVFALYLPQLKDRKEDIPALVELFLKNVKMAQVKPEALQLLLSHSWPGNIRELQNTMERAVVMCDKGVIEAAHLPLNVMNGLAIEEGTPEFYSSSSSIDGQLQIIEKGMIVEALKKAGGVQVKAAELLGINQRSLWHRIKKHNIDAGSFAIKKE